MEPAPTENLWLKHVHQLPNLGMAGVCTSPALKETNRPACWAALLWSNSLPYSTAMSCIPYRWRTQLMSSADCERY